MSHTLRYLRLPAPKQLTTTTAFIFVMLFVFLLTAQLVTVALN